MQKTAIKKKKTGKNIKGLGGYVCFCVFIKAVKSGIHLLRGSMLYEDGVRSLLKMNGHVSPFSQL